MWSFSYLIYSYEMQQKPRQYHINHFFIKENYNKYISKNTS